MPNLQKPDRSIPSLDGLRAISVLMVVGLHTLQRTAFTHPHPMFLTVLSNGSLGVRIFFVISGYLITRLLLREYDQNGTISLGRFYLRRAFRILPPLYFYIAFLCVLGLLGRLVVPWPDVVGAMFFFRNYMPHAELWALEHTWSLCIEEQFYLLWPAVLIWALLKWKGPKGRTVAARIAIVAIVVEPFVRTACMAFRVPYLHNPGQFHMNCDTIMFGCVAALLEGYQGAERLYQRVMRYPWVAPFVVYIVSGYLTVKYQNYYSFPLGLTLDGFLLSCTLVWCVRNPQTLAGRFLNFAPVRKIGVLSYSLYLWQTFFLHHQSEAVFGGRFFANTFPGNWLMIAVAGVFSFYVIEQPSLRLRDHLARRRSPV